MNIKYECNENEFPGEIAKYCIDENYIWFYDEISGGVYRLDKNLYSVEIILTPMEIHSKKIFPIRQILKWKNKIYLIPNNISYEWLVYDIVDKRLRSVLLFSQSYVIGNAVNIGKWIYLIPEKTNHMLAIVEAETLNVKVFIRNWYKNSVEELECWGYSKFEDKIIFPVIGTSEIFQIQGDQIVEISSHIKQPIYSISLNGDMIWVLPSKGKSIFFIDKSSGSVHSVEFPTSWYENVAEQFVRIIAINKYVYLFPRQGSVILVLEINSKEWTVMCKENEPLYRSLYQKTRNFPYWGYYFNEGKLYILPLQYHFTKIDMKNKTISHKALQCSTTFIVKQYILWVQWLNEMTKFNFVEWEVNSLKNFEKAILKNSTFHSEKNFGKNIWMMVNRT